MGRRRAVLVPVIAVVIFWLASFVALKMDGIPYNVRELAGRFKHLAPIALAVAMIGFGGLFGGFAKLWKISPKRFLIVYLPVTITLSTVIFFALLAVVPIEAIDDIVGWPVLNIGRTLERSLRFIGLVAGPIAAMTLGARLADDWDRRNLISGFVLLISIAAISYAVVVPLADTNNVVELLRDNGGTVAAAGIFGFFLLTGAASAMLANILAKPTPGTAFAGLASMLVSIPAAWILMVVATNPRLEKYGSVFSARQFILSPDRSNYLEDPQLAVRFAIAYAVILAMLGVGVFAGRELARSVAGPSGQRS